MSPTDAPRWWSRSAAGCSRRWRRPSWRCVDEGHKHAGHANAGKGHFHVRIVSAAFAGMLPIKRHRQVYAALDGLMDNGIHALSIDAKPPAS